MMKNKLVELRASLQELKEASMFKKAEAAEASLMAALALLENMVAEIEKLKKEQVKEKAPTAVKAKPPAKSKETN